MIVDGELIGGLETWMIGAIAGGAACCLLILIGIIVAVVLGRRRADSTREKSTAHAYLEDDEAPSLFDYDSDQAGGTKLGSIKAAKTVTTSNLFDDEVPESPRAEAETPTVGAESAIIYSRLSDVKPM
jgi:hypothetical protein